MHHFSIFYVLLLQIILLARPTVSQLGQDRIHKAFVDAGLLPNEGVVNIGYSVDQPVKHCSTIKYPFKLDPISFLIDICFDKSSRELDGKLKVGDVDSGQAKGTFDGGVLISFDHGRHLNGHHRYYVKGNELWLRYSNVIDGKDYSGDINLRPLYPDDSEGPNPRSKGNATKSKRKGNAKKGKRKGNANKPKPKGNAAQPKPQGNAPKLKTEFSEL